MAEKQQKKAIKISDILPPSSMEVIGQLNDWAHAGTKEAMTQLKDFIKKEKDLDLRGHAEIALDECQFFYYSSDNEREEKDFLLAKMIINRENRIIELQGQADSANLELEKLGLEREVHAKILKSDKYSSRREDWKYNFSEDYCMSIKHRLSELEEDIKYKEAWIEIAKKQIKSEKYKNIPYGVLDHIHSDAEGINFWEDEEEKEGCDCDHRA